jgi:flagellar hook protein FlgE
MSLTGALLAGVSGLQAQSNGMGIISDNIANLNTVGYKKSNATFSTLVVNSAATTTYSPGGVQSGRFALVSTQGTLQASNSPLDVAITGNGFFAVNDQGNGNGNNLYTRAGSFHQDVQGRLVNSAGMFLEGWVLTQAGTIQNINQLQVVSVGTTNGVAVGTQHVTVGANFESNQTIMTGNSTSSTGTVTSSTQDLGPGGGTGANLMAAGDTLNITVNGVTTTYTYDDGTLNPPAPASGLPLNSAALALKHFNTLADLANLVNSTTGLQASITSSAGSAAINVTSPYAVTIADGTTGTVATNLFGSATQTSTATYTVGSMQTNFQTPTSGTAADFNDPIQVFDALGTAHTLNLSVKHTGTNVWQYELFDVDSDIAGTATGRGLLSAGTIQFNGDGTLNSVTAIPSPSATPPANQLPSGNANQALYGVSGPTSISINWSNGAAASTMSFNLGTSGALGTGKTDGLTQFAANFNKNFTNQDGAAVGLQTGVTIDKNGFVIASYSNGATQKLFQIPVTTFADPSALQSQDGNTFSQTVASGNFNWRVAGTGGAGTIAPSSLEESNADLGDEFANMITTQTAYSANSKTITTANTMLQQLLQIIQG